MSFHYPLILYSIPVLLSLIGLSFRHSRSWSFRSGVVALVRSLVVVCTCVAIAGPHTREERPLDALVAYLDVSSSITPTQGDLLLSKARSLADSLRVPLSVVPFAKTAATSLAPASSSERYEQIRQRWEELDLGASNLEAALTSSAGIAAPVALLLSDGYETEGDARDGTRGISSQRLFPLTAPGEDPDNALSISQLSAPLTVKAQKSVEIRATVSNSGTTAQDGTLEITHGDRVVLSQAVRITAGQDASVVALSDPALEGLRTVQATFSWRDADGEHSSTRTIWLSGEKRDKVLVLSGSSDDDRFLPRILQDQRYQLRSATTQGPLDALGSPSDYRVVVLNNVPAPQIPEGFLFALPRYVRGGGALVTIGGNQSYGLGRYIGSPLEEILPVRLVPPHQEKKRLNVALQLVVDKSRSMANEDRLEYAKAAAGEVIRMLRDEDYIGVIGFDEVPFIALPLSRVSTVRETALNRISRLFPTSRTNLFPALDEARRGLANVTAGRKHVIVLTDGKLPDAGRFYFDLIKQMRLLGITLSTVMVGSEDDRGFLAHMAQEGGGAFYQTNDPSNLPRVFLSDVKVATGERTLKEDPEIVVKDGPDPRVTTTIPTFPRLRGFVETLPRDTANTELVVINDEGSYPLLASWGIGDGRAVAFTSDANGRWSSEWMRWDRIQEFWSDVMETAMPRSHKAQSTMPFDLRTWVEGGHVVVDLSLFGEVGQSGVRGVVRDPRGETRELSYNLISPGHYQARIDRAMAGTYRAQNSIGDAQLPEVAWTLHGELFGERSYRKQNLALLNDVASRSGGMIDPAPESLRPLLQQVSDTTEYAQWFLIGAFLLFCCEALLRGARPRRA